MARTGVSEAEIKMSSRLVSSGGARKESLPHLFHLESTAKACVWPYHPHLCFHCHIHFYSLSSELPLTGLLMIALGQPKKSSVVLQLQVLNHICEVPFTM